MKNTLQFPTSSSILQSLPDSIALKKLSSHISQGISYLLLLFYLTISMYPFLWMISSALKDNTEALTSTSLIPKQIHLDVLVDVWNRLDFWKYFANSLLISIPVLVGVILVYSLAGYGFAKMNFWGKEFIYAFFLGLMVIPQVTVLVPLVQELRAFGLIGRDASKFATYMGLILPMINGGGPFAIFIFRNYFASLPNDLRDAAMIDGCSDWGVFFKIFMPLSVPAIATVGITNFISTWSAYVFPSVVLNNPDWMTLPLQLRMLDLQSVIQWNVRMAGSLFTVLPVVIAFIFLQRYYIKGLTAAAVK
ncbi:MAG TPA: carbohydrate ABC transporter permease [Anaerolineales bacterium]|nr:carbohydrate ABC transporter permease [Anaerolineales bacterium]